MGNEIVCSFCGENYNPANTILFRSDAEDSIFICEDCIEACSNALSRTEQLEDEAKSDIFLNFDVPSEMHKHFDKYIIGQETAKMIMSVAVYNHCKRIFYNNNVANSNADMLLKKSNILMVGPSGSGKTLFIETIAKKLNLPYSINDATSLTQSGYVGDDVEIILQKLVQNANGDIGRAENGIVFIDEIDKIGRKGENPSVSRDVSGEGVQQALLKMLDGTKVRVPMSGSRKHPEKDCLEIDTSNILFICGGAFEGIEKNIEQRVKGKAQIGFNSIRNDVNNKKSYNDFIHELNAKDLKKFGMMPELLGRLPVICTLEELDENALIRILTEPVDSIVKQYKTLFEIDAIELNFTKDCLSEIAKKAMETGTGARSLRNIMENFMLEYMYKAPDMQNVSKITLTKSCVTKKGKPQLEYVKTE